MTEQSKINFVGDVGISPIHSLSNTADILGRLLGLLFEEDTSGYYREFPAYCAYALGMKIALLGIPEEGVTISDSPIDFYSIQLFTLSNSKDSQDIDISNNLVDLIDGQQGIKCWKLE